ncbi:anhydro-N-acetylmuramic acid kinase [Vallitalea longa]|uniref:Anhydro-N-acetylmuramic acid kinase n=1 Tax=Vallitalea longa TaxID=2936439 RepID=A0A9W6DG06_9FIRM|nr:anhydro-N-acetylmuramic acid kinase [Vallitalea longa]GKX31801.1 anhydro-N-acetylmuramic acid kinase [Vallitalea longa]
MINKIQKVVNKEKTLAVGLMSGTSLDGVDAALVEIQNSSLDTKVKLIEFNTLNYNSEERNNILKICADDTSSVEDICKMNVYLGEKMAEAANVVIKKANLNNSDIDFISTHGQTIYHIPEYHATMQIGELAVIAERTGCITVGDYRPSDMAAKGQGAPLVPFTDYLLFRSRSKGRALINIGGISNVSLIETGVGLEDVTAFDMGPGNMLIDAIVSIGTNNQYTYDKNGNIASKGKVCNNWLYNIINNDEFITKMPPKSTGREKYTFNLAKELYNQGISMGLDFEDIIATITSYTIESIIMHFRDYIDINYNIDEVIISGGGVYNNTIIKGLDNGLKQHVTILDDWGYSSDAKEAIAFAILGNEFLHGNNNNLPSATGASKGICMGKLVLPS